MPLLLLLFTLILSAFLTGLIWFVQIVHYPGFLKIPASHFISFHNSHMQTTSWVVAAPMLLELIASVILLLYSFPGNAQTTNYISFACVLAIWVVTFFVSVPLHNQLVNGWKQELIQRLVTTNWIRTWAWTIRTVMLGYMLFKQLK
jgi:hypothetical protein